MHDKSLAAAIRRNRDVSHIKICLKMYKFTNFHASEMVIRIPIRFYNLLLYGNRTLCTVQVREKGGNFKKASLSTTLSPSYFVFTLARSYLHNKILILPHSSQNRPLFSKPTDP